MNIHRHTTRGFTLVELLISLIITVMVGSALATLLYAVARSTEIGIETHEIVIRSHALDSRVGMYTNDALALLDVKDDGSGFAIWLSDSRESGTVHATEIRWFVMDTAADTLTVQFVKFPDNWDQAQKDLYDTEYSAAGMADGDAWWTVRDDFQGQGYLGSTLIGDKLSDLQLTYQGADEYDADRIIISYIFDQADGKQSQIMTVSSFEDHTIPG